MIYIKHKTETQLVHCLCYLPSITPNCRVDMLFQQLLRLQFMNSKFSQQLSYLLAFQRLHTIQQKRVNYVYIFV